MRIDVKMFQAPKTLFGLTYHISVDCQKTLCGKKLAKDWKEISDKEIEADSRLSECGNCWGVRRKVFWKTPT